MVFVSQAAYGPPSSETKIVNDAMAEPLAESPPDQATLNSGDGSSGGRAATVLVRPVPASIVLKIWGVFSGGWVSKTTVAWALITVPVGSDDFGRIV